MYNVHALALPSKKFFALGMMLLSLLLAAYTPMGLFSSNAAAADAQLQTLKQKATSELERRITNYKKTLASMNTEVKVSPGNSNVNIANDKINISFSTGAKSTASPSPSPSAAAGSGIITDGLDAILNFPKTLKDQAKQFLEKIIEELTQILGKVKETTSLKDMNALTQNVDKQFGLDQLTQVQSAVTQAVQTLTGVFSNIQSTAQNLQGQVSKIRDCLKSDSGKVNVDANVSANGANGSVTGSGEGCEDLNLSSEDVANQAQSQLDNITTMMTTIATVLTSSIALLTSLFSQFSGMLGGLGSLGSLGNLGGLSEMLNPSQLSSLGSMGGSLGGLGNISGLLSSFSGMGSQLDIASGMAGNVQGLLGPLSSFISI